jgi:hypothetical protein
MPEKKSVDNVKEVCICDTGRGWFLSFNPLVSNLNMFALKNERAVPVIIGRGIPCSCISYACSIVKDLSRKSTLPRAGPISAA